MIEVTHWGLFHKNRPRVYTEAETLAALEKSGTEVYAAPIEIEHKEQLESLGISWSQCRTWRIGSEPVTVHLTPADKATYKFLVNELRSRHRDEYRAKRCMIPSSVSQSVRSTTSTPRLWPSVGSTTIAD